MKSSPCYFKHIIPIPNFIFCVLLSIASVFCQEEPDSIWISLKKEPNQKYPLENISYYPLQKIKVALVLSGGGIRGFAHIGVLEALEENNISINLIVGTSIGSIIGGYYAAGFSAKQIRKDLSGIAWSTLFNDETYRDQLFASQKSIPRRHIFQFRLDGLLPTIPSSVTQGQKIFQVIYNQLLKANFQAANNFDKLKIPFRAVATDLISGKKVVLGKGDLAEAINASMAIPLLFAPVEIDGMLLMDGGITDNLPVDVAFHLGADVVIAVDVTSDLRNREDINAPWEIADQVTSIMMKTATEESRIIADVVLKPDLDKFKGYSFVHIDSLITAGYKIGLAFVDSIQTLVRKTEMLKYNDHNKFGKLSSISHRGFKNVSFGEFESHLKVKPGSQVLLGDIRSDIQQMYKSGFFEDVKALIIRDSSNCKITYYSKEYPKINHVFFEHHNILPDSIFENLSRGILNKPLNINDLFFIFSEIRNLLIQKGCTLTEIRSATFIPNGHNLSISINEGYIRKIEISGNNRTKDFVIKRELPLKEGDVFHAFLATKGLQNIYSTNLFDRVMLNLDKKDGQFTVIIKVKEKKYNLTRFGAHFSLERQSEGFFELLSDNFTGSATTLSLFGMIGDFSRQLEASIYTIRLFNSYLTPKVSLYYKERHDRFYRNYIRKKNYLIKRSGGTVSVGLQIEKLGLISAQLKIESIDVHSSDPNFPNQDDTSVRSFVLRSVVDKRDKLPFPNKGIFNRWYWETGSQGLLGGKVAFTKVFLGLEAYYPFLVQFNYHPYLLVGSADLTLPFSEYFFFGGQNSFPGLYEKEKLGRQFFQTGVDIRYQLKGNFPLTTFLIANYSLGATWARSDAKIEARDFLSSFSATLAINSLLGPLKLTYAKIIGEREILYFSLGFNF